MADENYSWRSEVNKFVGPKARSGAKPRGFKQKIYLYILLKVSALLPGNSANKV